MYKLIPEVRNMIENGFPSFVQTDKDKCDYIEYFENKLSKSYPTALNVNTVQFINNDNKKLLSKKTKIWFHVLKFKYENILLYDYREIYKSLSAFKDELYIQSIIKTNNIDEFINIPYLKNQIAVGTSYAKLAVLVRCDNDK